MTLSRADRLARREIREPETTLAGYVAAAFEAVAASATAFRWPSPKYQKDPVGFAGDILGMELWSRQQEIATSVVEHRKTSVRSGHRIGKSAVCAVLALWFYCSFPKARVFVTGPTAAQVDDVIWREIKILAQERAGTCLACRAAAERANPEHPEYPRPCPHSALIDGVLHNSAAAGLVSEDHREISGHTADRPEALAGRASPHLFYIVDEASGVNDEVYHVIQGNLAAKGARCIFIGNPTRTEGTFYESHTSKKDQYHVIHVSSEEAARLNIDGLASHEWIRETADLYGGPDSGEFLIRVKGEFVPEHTQKVIPRSLIDEAFAAWPKTPAEGPLHIGVDVARFGDDDTAIAVRRGSKILEVFAKNGLDEVKVVDEVLRLADEHRKGREMAIVKVDSAGVGIPVVIELNKRKGRFLQVVPLHPGSEARLAQEYAYLRDQLWFSMAMWLREGGTLPSNERLAAELHSPVYGYDPRNRKKVESKDKTRKALKRSPDLADACCLAVWDEAQFQPTTAQVATASAPVRGGIDPVYGGASSGLADPVYGARRGRDPVYG